MLGALCVIGFWSGDSHNNSLDDIKTTSIYAFGGITINDISCFGIVVTIVRGAYYVQVAFPINNTIYFRSFYSGSVDNWPSTWKKVTTT